MALPKFIFTTSAKLDTVPIVDGQFIIVKDSEKIYVDMDTARVNVDSKNFNKISVSGGVITMTKNDGTTSTATINNASGTANGLLTSADKTKLDVMVPKSFSISTSGWTSVTSSSYGGYSYRASISNSSIKSTDSADVRFDLSCIAVCLTAQISPSVTTADGYIYIFAKTKPTATVSGVYLLNR